MKMLSDAGFRWVRIDLKWDLTEPRKEQYDFAPYDRLVQSFEPFGLRPLLILDYTNPLYDDGAPPHTDTSRQAFARWAVAAAKHFADKGAIWETYNEPNHAQFWPPQPNVNDYVALALTVGKAFRDAVPNEKLIGPATAGMDFEFLETCFKSGLLEYWSAVSVHPYRRNDPETAAEDYCRLRQMIEVYASDRAKSRGVPIISSEWGYSAVWPGMSEAKQGELLARQFLTNVSNGIAVSIWYDWRDDGFDEDEAEHHFGTVSRTYYSGRAPVYEPKPAYRSARTLSQIFAGYRFEKRLPVGAASDYVLLFRKGEERRIAAWTTAKSGRQLIVPLEQGRYAATRHTGEQEEILTAGTNGLSINLTTGPVYLRRQ
jgi:hypothetical protein